MSTNSSSNEVQNVVDGINVVLDAEIDAQHELEQAKREAEIQLAEVRTRVHRIGERANLRLTRIHQLCSRKVSEEIADLKLRHSTQRAEDAVLSGDPEFLNSLINEIADQMCGPVDMGVRERTAKDRGT